MISPKYNQLGIDCKYKWQEISHKTVVRKTGPLLEYRVFKNIPHKMNISSIRGQLNDIRQGIFNYTGSIL